MLETPIGALKPLGGHPTFPEAVAFLKDNALDLAAVITSYDDVANARCNDALIGRLENASRVLIHDGNGRLLRLAAHAAKDGTMNEVNVWLGTPCSVTTDEIDAYEVLKVGLFRGNCERS